VWDQPRSSFYAAQQPKVDVPPAGRRGPKPAIPDNELLTHIKADLASSLFIGEGHRPVFARLRLKGIRVSRTRVLRIMRENHLLSPHRCRKGALLLHEGKITTDAPNIMWGTDGTRINTVDDGWVWVFLAVEHWNAECVGWHVSKIGDRYAALEPLAQGLKGIYGGTGAGAARGLTLRMDNGSQYISDHFRKQIKFWGITPSFAYVEQPETNGVAERFNRTLKEQVVHGRAYKNIEELRVAIGDFVERYNHHWRPEKNGFLTPVEARQKWSQDSLMAAA